MLPAHPKHQRDFVPPQLTVERGGLYVSSETKAVKELESCFRDAAAAAKRSTNSKAYPGPMLAAMAVALSIPVARRLAALIVQNWKGGGSGEFGERIGHGVLTFNAQCQRKFSRDTKGAA